MTLIIPTDRDQAQRSPLWVELGNGLSRTAFALADNPYTVVKVAHDWHVTEKRLQCLPNDNEREWKVWNAVADRPNLRKWLAPSYWLSPCGRALVQRRAADAAFSDHDIMMSSGEYRSMVRSLAAQGIPHAILQTIDIHGGNALLDPESETGISVVDYAWWDKVIDV